MKQLKLFSIFIVILTLSCSQSKQDTGALHEKRVLILGNSITQHGGYVDYLEYFLRTRYPNQKLDIISIGLSSETANGASEEGHAWPRPCIHSRLDSALLLIKPDVVLSCYGMNDGVFSPASDQRFEAYKKGIYKLAKKVDAAGAQLHLLTPTPFDPDPIKERITFDGEKHAYRTPYYKYNDVLNTFSDWLLSIQKDGFKVIDLHNYLYPILMEAKTIKADSTFIPDGVHPNDAGHFLMAKKILLDLYPEIDMGDPYPTVRDLKNDSLFNLIVKRRKARSDGWRDYIGYTREKHVKSNNIDSTIQKVDALELKIKEFN